MHIEGPQHRPPQDLNCSMLQIATGCTHGKCRFCDIFTGVPRNRAGMLELLDNRIPLMDEKMARRMREMLHRASFLPQRDAVHI